MSIWKYSIHKCIYIDIHLFIYKSIYPLFCFNALQNLKQNSRSWIILLLFLLPFLFPRWFWWWPSLQPKKLLHFVSSSSSSFSFSLYHYSTCLRRYKFKDAFFSLQNKIQKKGEIHFIWGGGSIWSNLYSTSLVVDISCINNVCVCWESVCVFKKNWLHLFLLASFVLIS